MSLAREGAKLLNLDLCSGFLEGSLELLSLSLGDFLLNSLGSTVNKILGFLKSETESFLDDLDHLKLGLTGAGKDNVELSLLCRSCFCGCCGACYCYCSGCGLDTIFFLEDLSKFLNVFDSQVYQLFCKCFYICHNCLFFKLLLLLLLIFFFEGLDNSGDGLAAALQSAEYTLYRALEESDDVADEFFLALDGNELVEFVSTYECTFLYVST